MAIDFHGEKERKQSMFPPNRDTENQKHIVNVVIWMALFFLFFSGTVDHPMRRVIALSELSSGETDCGCGMVCQPVSSGIASKLLLILFSHPA